MVVYPAHCGAGATGMYVVACPEDRSHMLIDGTPARGRDWGEIRQGESDVLDAVQMPGRHQVHIDRSRDALLTDFGRATLSDRYLMPGEEFQDLFARVASYYGDDAGHAQRIYDYMSKLWFMPATPVLSNGGTQRGLPISCFLNEASDSLDGIVGLWNENVWLASKGGGIGSYWGNLRSIGEKVGAVGKTSGVIPFIRVMDSLTWRSRRARCGAGRRRCTCRCGIPRSRSSSRSAARPAAIRIARR